MLVNLLDDAAAPVYVLRLWAHCQNRKTDTFQNLQSEALKALCHFPGQANKLESSLVASGFIRRLDSGDLQVHGWAEYNAPLIAAWGNGRLGGRPKTPGIPTGNPRRTNKSRGKKEDKGKPPTPFVVPTLEEVEAYCRERKNRVNAQKFIAHYTSNGWRVGKNPMKDWRAAVHTWEHDNGFGGTSAPINPDADRAARNRIAEERRAKQDAIEAAARKNPMPKIAGAVAQKMREKATEVQP